MNHTFVGNIPVVWLEPEIIQRKRLIIWMPGFGPVKNTPEAQLRQFTDRGYTALAYDPYTSGERTHETIDDVLTRVRGNLRRYFWPVLAQTAEDVTPVIDWAIHQLGVEPEVGMGGLSMGGDIAVAAAGVDWRIRAVVGIVSTPDWMRPGSFEFPGSPDAVAQDYYDRRNPLTHLEAYRSTPAITFECGDMDTRVPPDGAEKFARGLASTYAACPERLRVIRHANTGHAVTPVMMQNCYDWFARFLP
jgi:dienelactone hydrolase